MKAGKRYIDAVASYDSEEEKIEALSQEILDIVFGRSKGRSRRRSAEDAYLNDERQDEVPDLFSMLHFSDE
jgi:hypothetical protein